MNFTPIDADQFARGSFFVFFLCMRFIGRFIVTSLFKFLFISRRVNQRRCSRIYQFGSKIKRDGWFMQFLQVSALCNQSQRKYQQLKTAKLLGSKTWTSSWEFLRNETIWYNGLKFSEITDVMLSQYSAISFYLLNQNDKPMLTRPIYPLHFGAFAVTLIGVINCIAGGSLHSSLCCFVSSYL